MHTFFSNVLVENYKAFRKKAKEGNLTFSDGRIKLNKACLKVKVHVTKVHRKK